MLAPVSDPRRWPDASAASPDAAALHALALESLGAPTARDSDAADAAIDARLRASIASGDVASIERALDEAPGNDVYRHVWRRLAAMTGEPVATDGTLAVTLFAVPLVIVAASTPPQTLDGVVPDVAKLVALLAEHGALRGNRTVRLSNALAGSGSLALSAWPRAMASHAFRGDAAPIDVPPSPLVVTPQEAAHLRFLVGSAVAAPGVDLLRDTAVARFGMPLSRELGVQLARPGLSLLALPRDPASPLVALLNGRAAQREVSAQLFASHAIRSLRERAGEPVAVVSAHRTDDGRGELRLSLSSPFDARDAEGFRCPLDPLDRVADVASMLVDLMHDCRIADVRVVPGVHADRDASTGLPLLFKPDAIPAGADGALH